MADPSTAPGYTIERIVEGSGFHTANGLAFGPDGRLYVASVLGESVFALDVATGTIEVAVAPFAGESDDLLFTPGGDLIWTALLEGVVRMRRADGTIHDLASGLPGANSIALTRDGRRLFVGQVFMGEGLWEIDLAGVAPPRLVVDGTGGLNAAQFGPDGLLYAPSWERGQVVRIDPDRGETTVLAEGFTKPGAVRFDARDQLYVLDDGTGELFALDPAGARYDRRSVAKLATSTDNFVFGPTGLAYVSNMVDNSVHAVDPATGAVVVGVELGERLAPGGKILIAADRAVLVLVVPLEALCLAIGRRHVGTPARRAARPAPRRPSGHWRARSDPASAAPGCCATTLPQGRRAARRRSPPAISERSSRGPRLPERPAPAPVLTLRRLRNGRRKSAPCRHPWRNQRPVATRGEISVPSRRATTGASCRGSAARALPSRPVAERSRDIGHRETRRAPPAAAAVRHEPGGQRRRRDPPSRRPGSIGGALTPSAARAGRAPTPCPSDRADGCATPSAVAHAPEYSVPPRRSR